MAHKVKTKEKIIRTKEVTRGREIYEYQLIMSESTDLASYKIPLYSISVRLKIGEEVSSARSREIFADAGRAICFFEKLVRNLVTPLNLYYVIEDELD